jgi:hypothetical protein
MRRWAVLALTPGRAFTHEVGSTRALLVGRGRGSGLDLEDPRVSERHLTLLAADRHLVLQPVRGAGDTLVNDVQTLSPLSLSPGDEVRLGDSRLVVLGPVSPPALPPPRLAPHDELMSRLEDELLRAGTGRPVGFAVIAQPALNVAARQALTRRVVEGVAALGVRATWGELASDLLAGIFPESTSARLEAVALALPELAGARARVATTRSPLEGLVADALVERALDRLAGARPPEPPLFTDPVMVRLAAALETLAPLPGPVLFTGPPGAGRATLALHLARLSGAPVTEHQAPAPLPGLPAGGVLLVRDVDLLARGAQETLLAEAARAGVRVLATSRGPESATRWPASVPVPPLAQRPLDIEALSEVFLARTRAATGRLRLALGPEARALLTSWSWPGNVRELQNVLDRAVRGAVRDEVGPDALPPGMTRYARAEDLRDAMAATERALLLEALARTRWNVTQASARLGLPRRTVVYRMRRLGLKRPAR